MHVKDPKREWGHFYSSFGKITENVGCIQMDEKSYK